MQRRAVPHSVAVAPGNGTASSAAPSSASRRKPRRRRKTKDCASTRCDPDVKSLVLIALLTAVLTASVVTGAAKFYQWVYSMADQQDRYGHRHHHVHDEAQEEQEKDKQADDDYDVLPWNPIYRIPDAMATVGDRTDVYATLRLHMDEILPLDGQRSLARVSELNHAHAVVTAAAVPSPMAHHSDQVGSLESESYDIYHCPPDPPAAYPFQWKLVEDILTNWPVTDVDTTPQKIYQGLCIFDYETDYATALRYRQAEVPFVVVNDPAVARTVERWNIPGYLSQLLDPSTEHRAEHNTNNHFMYHQPKRERRQNKHRHHGQDPQWMNKAQEPPPQEVLEDAHGRVAHLQRADVVPDNLRMTYDEWLVKANKTHVGPEEEHWYFRLIGCGYMDTTGGCDQGSSENLYDELPFFQPKEGQLYLGDPSEQKGIHCRFGMKGVIAENHFDASRNAIVVLGGRRRYILSHPNQCENLALLPREHESARHSQVDYTNPDLEQFPEFGDAMGNEVVMEAGQVLYLPTHWFHYIVSLDLNYQCNTRSGITKHYHQYIRECGF